jgi:hypothetical protein
VEPPSPIGFSDVNGNSVKLCDIFADFMYRRECVAYVGAGFSRSIGMPDWKGLVSYLISGPRKLLGYKSGVAQELLLAGDLAGAAAILKASLSPKDLELALNHLFGYEACQRAPADDQILTKERVDRLLRGHWAGIVTTNYDRLIENGLDHLSAEDWIANVQNHGDSKSLGHILSMASEHRIFFVKLHGSLSSSRIVLTTQDYNDAYLSSTHITAFLTSLFLCYHVIFLGCSLDDDVVRLRRRLFSDFKGHLPSSFALFSDTPADRAKAKLLSDTCGVEGIFYNNPDGKYRGLNTFLDKLSHMPRPPQAMLQVLKYPSLTDRVRRLRAGNLTLLSVFLKAATRKPIKSYSCTELHDELRSKEELLKIICGEDANSRVEHILRSRIQNLATQGLLIETLQESAEYQYHLSPRLQSTDIEWILKDFPSL